MQKPNLHSVSFPYFAHDVTPGIILLKSLTTPPRFVHAVYLIICYLVMRGITI